MDINILSQNIANNPEDFSAVEIKGLFEEYYKYRLSNRKKSAVKFVVKELSEIIGKIKTSPMQDLLLVDAINKALEMEITP